MKMLCASGDRCNCKTKKNELIIIAWTEELQMKGASERRK